MSLTLVVMAAGLGSRFGGTKQLAEVGPNGEAFLDFAVLDATAAGADKVVLIVRSDIEEDVRRHVDPRHPDVEIAYVRQNEHGPSRDKPWGTGHAVLTAAPEVDGSFIVVNADDYYGRSTYAAVAPLAAELPDDQALLAGFRMAHTLPSEGEVSRGVCEVDGDRLTSLVETHGIGCRADGSITSTDPVMTLADDTVSSMNFWAFPHRLFDDLERGFAEFLAEHGDEEKAEYLLPTVVHELMANDEMTVGVVPTDEPWVGVTNPTDLEVARATIAQLRA
ncbi:MAG: NTP transferase domain-containing protein [Acidimicrobiales bacterium]|nr:NTP transferase domain-containing protein [Acidimicrobiales bacterium]